MQSEDQQVSQPTFAEQYLTFTLGTGIFAIGIGAIKEIIEYEPVTAVPLMPPFVRGVINLRGAVVPVIDLSAHFGHSPTQITRRSCVVIVETSANGERQDLGVVVDAVNAVVAIPTTDIEPPPPFATTSRAHFIRGMGRVSASLVILLDLDHVLAAEELAGLTELGNLGAPADETASPINLEPGRW